jgi:hypothetical protein
VFSLRYDLNCYADERRLHRVNVRDGVLSPYKTISKIIGLYILIFILQMGERETTYSERDMYSLKHEIQLYVGSLRVSIKRSFVSLTMQNTTECGRATHIPPLAANMAGSPSATRKIYQHTLIQ